MSMIAGLMYPEPEVQTPEHFRSLLKAIPDYPADDRSSWEDAGIALGQIYRWITPESQGERLPRYEKNGSLVIAADAVLDNREELFGLLGIGRDQAKGMTDSELILRAYRTWGTTSPRYLTGDFAYMIWDGERKRLFGARDLLGTRTLYYHRSPNRFAFCTLIAPLFALPWIRKELYEPWLAEFLGIPHILDAVDVRSTVYKGIWQVPPGHSILVTPGTLTLEQYDVLTEPEAKLRLSSDREYVEAFREVFTLAVKSKSRTFRKVGASLSGGLDSGAVASFAAGILKDEGRKLHTYSSIPRPDFIDWSPKRMAADESLYIRDTVDYIGGLEHRYCAFEERHALSDVDDLIGFMEAPYKFFENSHWIKGLLELARQDGVGVMLNGSRGNYTISWGPAFDFYAILLRKLRWFKVYRELKHYGRHVAVGRSKLIPQLFRLAYGGTGTEGDPPPSPRLIHPELALRTGVEERLRLHNIGLSAASDDFTERRMQFEDAAVSNHLGTSNTKLALRYGLMERDPTGDPRVIRFCLSLPYEQFIQGGRDRALIRRAAEGYLPDSVRLNQRVRGLQGADWLHRLGPHWRAVAEEARRLCDDSAVAGLLNVDQIRSSLTRLGHSPSPDQAYNPDIRLIMQSIIVYRFLRKAFL